MKKLVDYLIEHKITVATAESCTGGAISREFVAFPGVSSVFLAGLCTYANEAKEGILGVDPEIIRQHGAVSYECAGAMLSGVRRVTGAQAAVCTTGIAGPGGGTSEKPVGLVYIGVSFEDKEMINRFVFPGDRESVIRAATETAIEMLKNIIIYKEA